MTRGAGQRITIDQDERPERTLLVYLFDARTGVWAGTREVHGERFGNGDRVYILRQYETFEEPPDTDEGEVAVFIERTRSWVTVQDHRGETWLDHKGIPQLIGRVGNPAEWDCVHVPETARRIIDSFRDRPDLLIVLLFMAGVIWATYYGRLVVEEKHTEIMASLIAACGPKR